MFATQRDESRDEFQKIVVKFQQSLNCRKPVGGPSTLLRYWSLNNELKGLSLWPEQIP
jgi:hypothetical protein